MVFHAASTESNLRFADAGLVEAQAQNLKLQWTHWREMLIVSYTEDSYRLRSYVPRGEGGNLGGHS